MSTGLAIPRGLVGSTLFSRSFGIDPSLSFFVLRLFWQTLILFRPRR